MNAAVNPEVMPADRGMESRRAEKERWVKTFPESIRLRSCPVSDANGQVLIDMPYFYGKEGVYVHCTRCDARTCVRPINEMHYNDVLQCTYFPTTARKIRDSVLCAIRDWNSGVLKRPGN